MEKQTAIASREYSLVLKGIVTFLALTAVGLMAWYLVQVLFIGFAGLILASAVITVARWASRRSFLSYSWAATLLVLGCLAIGTGLGFFIVPTVSDQIEKMTPQIQQGWESLKSALDRSPWTGKMGRNLSEKLVSKDTIHQVLAFVSGTFGVLASVLLLVALGLYVAYDRRLYERGAVKLVPPRWQDEASELFTELRSTLSWWLGGRLVSMAIVAVFTTLGLWLIGMDLALTLGLLAGILSFVPNLGPALSVVPAVLLAVPQGQTMVLWVMAVYGVAQFLESYFITPLIQERAVSVPPALLLFAQVALGILVGVWGILLASPLLACTGVLVKRLYVQKM